MFRYVVKVKSVCSSFSLTSVKQGNNENRVRLPNTRFVRERINTLAREHVSEKWRRANRN